MNTKERPEISTRQAPLAQLERSLIDEFVLARGYDPLSPNGAGAAPDASVRAYIGEARRGRGEVASHR